MKPFGNKYVWAMVSIAVMIGLGAGVAHTAIRPDMPYPADGKASYYARCFHGKTTANGERYNKEDLTAAHPFLAFGTIVQVHNLKNGKTVHVRINDRGPFKKGRILDLSFAAAKQLGMVRDGVIKVRITPLR